MWETDRMINFRVRREKAYRPFLCTRMQFTDDISRALSLGCLGLKSLTLGNSPFHTEQPYFTTS